jgi:hypothetical protein
MAHGNDHWQAACHVDSFIELVKNPYDMETGNSRAHDARDEVRRNVCCDLSS